MLKSNYPANGNYRPVSNIDLGTEIRTPTLDRIENRRVGRFLKGPIPLGDLSAASKLSGKCLAIYIAVNHQTAITGRKIVRLPKWLLLDLGVGKDAKSKGLRQLEKAGLVDVIRSKGRAARVELKTLPRNIERDKQ